MTAPSILLVRASLNVEIAWPGHRWVGECMDDWGGWVRRNSAPLCQPDAVFFALSLSLSAHRLLNPHPSPLLWHTLLSINGVSLG